MLVDSNTRRNMEGMLKTWKEPIPGSMDPRPVFPIDTVRPIENALIKAKTAALQNTRQVQQQPDYRNTPTPPQFNGQFSAPQNASQAQPCYATISQQVRHPRVSPDLSADLLQPIQYQQLGQPNLTSTPSQQHLYQYPPPSSRPVSQDVESIKRDVDTLVSQRQAQFGVNPYDAGLRQQLQALLQLQQILKTEQLGSDSLLQIRNQVSGLAAAASQPQAAAPKSSTSTPQQWQPTVTTAQPQHLFPQPLTAPPRPAVHPIPAFPPGALDGLQALLAGGQKPGTPQMRAAAPTLQNATHTQLNNVQNQTAAASSTNGSDLMASLARNGLLPSISQPQPTPTAAAATTAPPPSDSTAALLQSLQGLIPTTSKIGTPTLPNAQLRTPGKPRIPMNAASLKAFRPELVHSLYEAQPNQCSTCGRRFLATEEGRAKKDRHIDWHFRTNQRIADPNTNRGAHRDWFLPEIEWIQLTEFDPSTTTASDTNAGPAAAVKKQKRPEDQYVRAPAGMTSNTCSICFEEMKTSFSDEIQDWVFMNATAYNGKIVHATCLAEMQKGQSGGSLAAALAAAGGQRQRSATPDSSLGKRKADGSMAGVGRR